MPTDDTIKVNILGSQRSRQALLSELIKTYNPDDEYKPATNGINFHTIDHQPNHQETLKIRLWDHSETECAPCYFAGSGMVVYCISEGEDKQNCIKSLNKIVTSAPQGLEIILCTLNAAKIELPTSPEYNNRISQIEIVSIDTSNKDHLKRIIETIIKTYKAAVEAKKHQHLDTTEYESIYRKAGGSYFRARDIFGFFSYRSLEDIAETLLKRAHNNPNGASAETLKQFPQRYRQNP
jgi:hypothetical protein